MRSGDKRRAFCSPINIYSFPMKIIKYSLGIDIASKSMRCCLSSIDFDQTVSTIATRSFANTLAGFNSLDRWIRKYGHPTCPLVVTLEATGVYYEACALYLKKAAYHVSVVLPN